MCILCSDCTTFYLTIKQQKYIVQCTQNIFLALVGVEPSIQQDAF